MGMETIFTKGRRITTGQVYRPETNPQRQRVIVGKHARIR
jgi:hypothetical protein